jgi:hypothetical protein
MSKMMGLMVLAAVLSLSNAQAVVEVAAPAKLPFQNVTTGYTVRVRSPSTDCRVSNLGSAVAVKVGTRWSRSRAILGSV